MPRSLLVVLALMALIAVFSSSLSLSVHAAVTADEITNLPGYGVPPTKQYSGFIAADSAKTVFLHYWLVTNSNASAPLVMWMNGGPGCSSMEGLLYEQGPFRFTGATGSDGIPTLTDNPNAWSTVAHMLFLEQPAGVGFSYATNGSTTTDDFVQSQNTYGFVLNFLAAFPEYAKNDFYITGESYAGIYVPTLANRIRLGNAAGNSYVNLKGFAVGNGCIGNSVGSCGDMPDADQIEIDFFYGHGMVSQDLYAAVQAACNWSAPVPSTECSNLMNSYKVGNIDIYNVYDTCNDMNQQVSLDNAHLRAPVARHLRHRASRIGDPIVCVPEQLGSTYLSSASVQQAIHVASSPNSKQWTVCSQVDYTANLVSLLPLYPDLIAQYNVLIYSGDADACVPFNGAEQWTRKLGYKAEALWSTWTVTTSDNSWVGGFATTYNSNFTFVTVKHAGHMVPQYEPEGALTMFKNWIFQQPWH